MAAIRLFDITSKLPSKAWSPNVWKTRYILNYKNLPYETTWVEYPDIASTCLKIGASPTTRAGKYTLPVIQDTNTGAVISDSWNIVEYLESTYPPANPEHSLIPPGTRGLQLAFLSAFRTQLRALWPIAIPQEVAILTPRSEEYFRKTREEFLKPENLKEEMVRGHWNQLERDLGVVDSWIRKEDIFVMGGGRATYPDFVVAALMIWCRTLWGRESGEWGERIAKWHGGRWGRLVEKLQEYEKIV
ncbi:hypothetical protein E1B28_002229 [Marasmius oreades]|uniref:GST N-terminal domain-containing protein n=1 Tax=Marasmius oreades TaxID=181124 RepID=A0A9P7RML8_9AGAR|nr:uncharacterized protein E1B28_002229 [Marasmius oreades]KAG7086262.1 hypothetical protein E1B28_002229 [Marasmius oreades]